jgi:transposase
VVAEFSGERLTIEIERLFAWRHNFRRLVSRWEYDQTKFLGMLQLGYLIILLGLLGDGF